MDFFVLIKNNNKLIDVNGLDLAITCFIQNVLGLRNIQGLWHFILSGRLCVVDRTRNVYIYPRWILVSNNLEVNYGSPWDSTKSIAYCRLLLFIILYCLSSVEKFAPLNPTLESFDSLLERYAKILNDNRYIRFLTSITGFCLKWGSKSSFTKGYY